MTNDLVNLTIRIKLMVETKNWSLNVNKIFSFFRTLYKVVS